MIASGTSFLASERIMPRVTPRAFTSYVQAETIPRSFPVMTGFPARRGSLAISHEAKKESLGVRASVLSRYGAVSEETARAMAARCFSPPDRTFGRMSRTPPRPTQSRSSVTSAR